MGTTKSKPHEITIDDRIDKKVLEKPGPLINQMSMNSDQSANSTKLLSQRSDFKLLTDRSEIKRSHSRGSSSTVPNSQSMYNESNVQLFDDLNTKKLLDLSLPSANDSARMDINTMIITIPASSLDTPSLHGKGLSLSSPMNSARRDSSARASPSNSFRNSVVSPHGSFRSPPPSSTSPALTPPVSSRRHTLDGKNINLPTIHSALNFDVLLSPTDDEYGVGFIDFSQDEHLTTKVTPYS